LEDADEDTFGDVFWGTSVEDAFGLFFEDAFGLFFEDAFGLFFDAVSTFLCS